MKSICVYCGSNPGKRPAYQSAAKNLGVALAKNGISLIYGGASVGIMGLLADTVLAEGGEVIGVMPQALVDKEVAHHGLTELKVVQSMHERKAMMVELADGFIALPGGLGTLEEIFETLTWAQLGFHQKPCALLNTEGYYDHLTRFLAHAVEQRFIKDNYQEILLVDATPEALLASILNHTPPAPSQKWISADET